jgi:hypothetical protein
MTKTYKVSYKTYFNDRLKQVSFHGKITYPLYVQVTFDRKTIFFKSYYFELFSKARYFLTAAGLSGGPTIEDIIKKEKEVIDFIIDKNQQDFSLDLFKKEYAYYSKDLCDITEEGFIDYMYIFFQDKGMPDLAVTVRQGSRFRIVYDVVRDMKRAFNKPLYDELVENSFYMAPPYFPLYGFMQQTKKWPMLSLTVMEWEDIKTKARFAEYMQKYYPDKDALEVMNEIDKWLIQIKKQDE